MKKSDAISLFGSIKQMAEALKCTRQAVGRWEEELTLAQADRVRGAYARVAEERDRLVTYKVK